jgi:hypothetical protein
LATAIKDVDLFWDLHSQQIGIINEIEELYKERYNAVFDIWNNLDGDESVGKGKSACEWIIKESKAHKKHLQEIKNPRRKRRGIEDFSLKSLRMWGNKSPTPPVFTP